jgi:hypothetical protein
MDRMASLAAFTKVVGAGSFSAASSEMKLSQASVTEQIQELEGWLARACSIARLAVRRLGAALRKTIFDIYAAMPSSWNTPRMACRSAW